MGNPARRRGCRAGRNRRRDQGRPVLDHRESVCVVCPWSTRRTRFSSFWWRRGLLVDSSSQILSYSRFGGAGMIWNQRIRQVGAALFLLFACTATILGCIGVYRSINRQVGSISRPDFIDKVVGNRKYSEPKSSASGYLSLIVGLTLFPGALVSLHRAFRNQQEVSPGCHRPRQ